MLIYPLLGVTVGVIGVATPGVGSPTSRYDIPMINFATLEFFCRHLSYKRRDARRRFASIVSNAFPRLVFALFEICRRRDGRRRFANGFRCSSPF
jgi:hypothetical protein